MAARAGAGRRITLVGAGRMGGALLQGWVKAGLVSPARPADVIEPHPSAQLRAIVAAGAARLVAAPPAPAREASLLVLAVKPQSLAEALAALRPLAGAQTAALSIIAGATIASIASALEPQSTIPVVRSMPNTPAAIGAGITAAFAGPGADDALKREAEALLAAVGEVVWVGSEDLLDAVTAVSGSGPAYVFLLVEALTDAAIAVGLPPETAAKLARETVAGSAALMKASPETPAELRRAVTSKGGTTEAALKVLMGADGLAPLMRRAVEAALARAKELGKGG